MNEYFQKLQYKFNIKCAMNLHLYCKCSKYNGSINKIMHTRDTECLEMSNKKEMVIGCHMSCVRCHVSHITCCASPVTCGMSLTPTATATVTDHPPAIKLPRCAQQDSAADVDLDPPTMSNKDTEISLSFCVAIFDLFWAKWQFLRPLSFHYLFLWNFLWFIYLNFNLCKRAYKDFKKLCM